MLRTLLVGILAVSAVVACSGKSDAPAAQPGVSAGKVVELTGKVTATRGTAVRTLLEGGEISSDDVIDTAVDSRVVILMAHNNARWDLGPNKHGKVGESLAWTAARVDLPAVAVKEETSTAGRYADKNAATTDTTTRQNHADSRAVMAPKGDVNQDPQATATPQPGPGASATPQVQPTAPAPPPPIETESTRDDKDIKVAPTPPARIESAKPKPGKSLDKLDDLQGSVGVGVIAQKPGGTGRSGGSIGGTKESLESPERALQLEIRRMFAKERTAMAACIQAPTERLMVTITVTQGVYSLTSTDPAATDKTRACLAKIAKRYTAKTKFDTAVTTRMTVVK